MPKDAQVNLHNRTSKQAKITKLYKKAYHKRIRHREIEDDEIGGHEVKRYRSGWMD